MVKYESQMEEIFVTLYDALLLCDNVFDLKGSSINDVTSFSGILTPCTPPRPSEICEKNWSTKSIFDIPFMIQSHAESMKKVLGAL